MTNWEYYQDQLKKMLADSAHHHTLIAYNLDKQELTWCSGFDCKHCGLYTLATSCQQSLLNFLIEEKGQDTYERY